MVSGEQEVLRVVGPVAQGETLAHGPLAEAGAAVLHGDFGAVAGTEADEVIIAGVGRVVGKVGVVDGHQADDFAFGVFAVAPQAAVLAQADVGPAEAVDAGHDECEQD